MKKFARVLRSDDKEKINAPKMTAVHKRKDKIVEEKYNDWMMPPHPERYIKHKRHDPL